MLISFMLIKKCIETKPSKTEGSYIERNGAKGKYIRFYDEKGFTFFIKLI